MSKGGSISSSLKVAVVVVVHWVPKKISYFAWLKPYKVGNFFWDTVYMVSVNLTEKLLLINKFLIKSELVLLV